ncbi:translocation/assembly module TamB domain-containing protein [Variovorax terrae]|uniref:Translocation/assembly module TamB domain-containing protein n=1 Tax=Variovorax terrae TaxID=2923278 RepID=A0A9X2AN68_9BURK|nr:translocation/assembly module TamB domain-containing protein [Variovorax terrae]MCJ0762082.1 translocation/assembly module TamB domain-containing protein [Variovorax terrae]
MAAAPTPPPFGSRAAVARWLVRGLRLLVGAGCVLVLLFVLAVSLLWWWSGQDGSLGTTLRLAAHSQPLVAERVSGSLRHGGQIGRLAWEQEGLSVQASDVRLAWQPLALLSGEFNLDHLSAATLRIDDQRPPAATPATAPPRSLALPLRLSVDTLALGQLQWVGPPAFEARDIAGRYEFDSRQHLLQLDSLQAASGRYHGRAALLAGGDLRLDASLAGAIEAPIPGGEGPPLQLTFTATAAGPLADLQLQALLQAMPAAGRPALAASEAPQATATARITGWAAQPVAQAQASFRQIDLAALWPDAPQTRLTGEAHAQPDASRSATWSVAATLDNGLPGPLDRQRLPLQRLQAEGEWHGGMGLVRTLKASLGGGELTASGGWTDAGQLRWTLKADARGIDPGQLHSRFAALPLDGHAAVQGHGQDLGFDAQLLTHGSSPAPRRTAAGDRPARGQPAAVADLRALHLRDAAARGRWSGGVLQLDALQVRTDDAQLDAALRLQPATRAVSGRLSFHAPGLQAQAQGELRDTAGAGQLGVQGRDLAQAMAWLRRLPGLPAPARDAVASGQGELDLRWQGGWRDPSVQARLDLPSLDLRAPAASSATATPTAAAATPAAALWQLRATSLTLSGRLAEAQLALRGQAASAGRRYALQLQAQGGQPGFHAGHGLSWGGTPWQASVTQLEASLDDPALGAGAWRLATRGPVALRWTPGTAGGQLTTSAGEAALLAPTGMASGTATAPAVLAWQPVRWRPGELVTAGRLTGLPLAWIELVAGPQLAGTGLTGSLVFDGDWDATLGDTLRLKASVARSRGDLTVLAETTPGVSTRVSAGVREARLSLVNEGDAVRVALRWDSERAGTVDGTLATRLSRGPDGAWQWPADAPLSGRLRARLPRIGVWSVLAPPGWRLRGSLGADVAFGGTRGAPGLTGSLQADDLALRSVVDGIEFGNGRLRAQLDGTRMHISEFLLEGAGDKGTGGRLTARGEAGWIDGQPRVRLDASVRQLRASIRTDRQITVSGDLQAGLAGSAAEFTGSLRVDQARILLPDEDTPKLGDDVVVHLAGATATGAQAPAQTSSAPDAAKDSRTLRLAVQLDLGRDFRIQGRGIDTRIRGTLELAGSSLAAPRLTGTVNTFGGQYRAYGQRLDVEQGVVRFTGPIDNPALDILALRPNMMNDQKVGVQITGTALLPRVRLYAQPDMPDAEKLSWLVVGRASASGGAEAALLQQAALALLGSRSGGMSGGLAASLGLDELSFRGASTSSTGATTEGAVTLGKRFSRNFYAAYERSLSGALGTLYVFYDISRRITLRAQTGEQSAVDLIFTVPYD